MGHLNDGTLLGAWVCSDDVIGAGGFMSDMAQALDGSQVGHSDSTSPYYRHPDSGRWKRFLRVGDGSNAQDDNYNGSTIGLTSDISAGITIARTNGQVMATIISGVVFRTTAGAEGLNSVERLTVPQLPGGWWQSQGSLLEIDPNNENVWWFATPDGLLISDDMFDTWDAVPTTDVPAGPSEAAELSYAKPKIIFDRTSLSGGKSQVGYVMVPGHRIRKTTDAGATWAEVPAGLPVTFTEGETTRDCHYNMEIDPHTSELHVCRYNGSHGPHWRLRAGTWTASGQDGVRPVFDPHNAGRIYLPTTGSNMSYSLNDGSTWAGGGLEMMTQSADRIRWLGTTNQVYMAHGRMVFDEVVEGRAWLAEGTCIWRCDAFPSAPSGSAKINWIEDGYGLETMTMKVGHVGPDGSEGWSFWDRTCCIIARDEMGQFPRSNGPITPDVHAVNPFGGGGTDWAFDDPEFWVGTSVSYSPEIGGWSRKPFASWTSFEGDVSVFAGGPDAGQSGGGNIAALSTTVFIQQQGGGGKMMYTEDRGATWAPMGPFFGPNFAVGNSFFNHNLERKILVKDAYHANTAFFVHPGVLEAESLGGTADLASRGVWKIVYNGPGSTPRFTCTRQRNTPISGFGSDSWNAKLVQYDDGHWLWTSGPDYHLLWESTDDGVTWTPVTGTDDINGDWGGNPLGGQFGPVYGVAVGRGALPGDPKTVFVIGHRPPDGMNHYNVVGDNLHHDYYGTWLCRNFTDSDADRVWKRVVKHPNGILGGYYGRISDIVGNPIGYGEFSVGNGAGGVFRMRHLDRRRASVGAPPAPSITAAAIFSGDGNNIARAVTAGKRYLVATWASSDMRVDGSNSGVTQVISDAGALEVFLYVPASSGTKTFVTDGSNRIISIVEITGSTGLNGSHASISNADRSGAFSASAVTGFVVGFIVETGGTLSVNMTALGASGPFKSYYSATSVTPAGSWSGHTALAAVGLA